MSQVDNLTGKLLKKEKTGSNQNFQCGTKPVLMIKTLLTTKNAVWT